MSTPELKWSDEDLEDYARDIIELRSKIGVVEAFVTAVERLREAKARIAELESELNARTLRMGSMLEKVAR